MKLTRKQTFYLQMLKDIEKGVLTVEPTEKPSDVYCGDITYRISNGWTMEVFNDCNEFDYVSSFTSPDGAKFDFWLDSYQNKYQRLKNYRPDDMVEKTIYLFADNNIEKGLHRLLMEEAHREPEEPKSIRSPEMDKLAWTLHELDMMSDDDYESYLNLKLP